MQCDSNCPESCLVAKAPLLGDNTTSQSYWIRKIIVDVQYLRHQILRAYAHLRMGMGIIALLFPFVLWGVGSALDIQLQDSMSAYYHTSMRNAFVGFLFALAGFLILYSGFSRLENWALNLAGAFAVGVAICPMTQPADQVCRTFTANDLHYTCAILFFACIAYVCIFRADDTLVFITNENHKRMYKTAYLLIGILMLALPGLVALIFYLGKSQYLVFWVETTGDLVFGLFWMVKSIELNATQAVPHLMAQLASQPSTEDRGRI
jgi:hypothetical protein